MDRDWLAKECSKWPPTKRRWGPPARQRFPTSSNPTTSKERATGLEPATSSLGSEGPQRGRAPTSVNAGSGYPAPLSGASQRQLVCYWERYWRPALPVGRRTRRARIAPAGQGPVGLSAVIITAFTP
jgi:hypothetical protein